MPNYIGAAAAAIPAAAPPRDKTLVGALNELDDVLVILGAYCSRVEAQADRFSGLSPVAGSVKVESAPADPNGLVDSLFLRIDSAKARLIGMDAALSRIENI